MTAGWVVAACVLAAAVALGAAPERRLRRLGPVAHRSPRTALGRGRLLRRREHPSAAEVATVAAELATLLRSGLAPASAWGHVAAVRRDGAGPVADAVRRAAEASGRGDDVASVLRSAAGRCRDPAGEVAGGLRGLAAAWHVAQRSGAPTAEVLARYADGLRRDVDAGNARESALAAPRATARVLTALPPVGLLLGAGVGADPVTVLTGTAVGRASAVVGAACAVTGWWWSRRLVAAAREA